MSADTTLWIIMAACLVIGCPIFVSLGVASTVALLLTNIPMRIVALDMLKVMDMFPLLAVVGFIFAGALMEKGGMARQIVDIASLFVGRIRGGLGITTILGCLFFAAMIGSGPGTVAAMGSIMIPTMVRRGYSPEYAAGVCATGGTLGILIPPSNPMIIYGIIASTSISALFTAGFVPGFLLGLLMMGMAYLLARRSGFTGAAEGDAEARFWPLFRRNFFSLMAPVIILGSIYAGICTPVEASVVAVFYALFVGACITRELRIPQIWDAIKLTNVSAGTIIIVLGVSTLFGRILTMQRIPHQLAAAMMNLTDNPFVILLLIGLLLLFLGMFMETLATIVILAPIFLPLITRVGIDPVFFGIFWVITNEVALLSPPLGVNLFIAQNLSGISFERVARGALPYMLLIISFILVLILVPDLVLWLPRLTGQY
ncbi:MAG TPA: TRAP transporter large permease [Candidatus Bilophila faecipullorum]|uniref:TRAP transporter large permease n=3 Tax=Bilophila TaxID=35832 RepID=A0A9D1R0G1_9BACT|nr:TRAP transporter large permease [uncultured Bilophila sp.]HIW78545.1 TRAP transporter large permease [Candidatus Bilophila faecipullorum]